MNEGPSSQLLTTKRSRKLLAGAFTTAGTGVPTAIGGSDGVAARTGVGAFTVTLPKKYGCVSVYAGVSDQDAGDDKYLSRFSVSNSTGVTVITIVVWDQSGAAATETTGHVVNWMMVTTGQVV
jgi:hypothetical protein